ncbi:MAG: hypothetical protein GF344_18815 [Chitinivibrionales bacterium]|nr:hypothetical protein [Chitinivibrionales bacterium]MBD3358698.1 hypothetical protein [Chitinivibrionales bacterium]
MKQVFPCLAVSLLFTSIVFAGRPTFVPYGFIKGDMYYATDPVTSYGFPSLTCISRAVHDTVGGEGLAFTAQHSRFGLKGSGESGGVAVGGVIELDFFVIAANANAKPRMRLAYAWLKPTEGLDIRIGQQWDLFSPLNPTMNNTGTALWYHGNFGFRRPQFQVRYGRNFGRLLPELQVSVGETAKENEGKGIWLGADNRAAMPMIQGRLAVGLPCDAVVGLSGFYAAHGEDHDVTSTGIAADAAFPLHELFALKGEFARGKNLNNADIFTIGGSGNADNEVVTIGYWANIISKPLKHLHVVVGGGQERTTEGLQPGKGDTNLTLYGDLIFPIGKYLAFTAEYQWIRTKWAGQDDPYTAGVVNISGKLAF